MQEKFMRLALEQAEISAKMDEVPIGAVIVKDNQIISVAHNLCESKKDPTAHAELLAIKDACKKLNDWRLDGCSLYVTAEPCCMCAGAIINARISKVYFGTFEPNTGACGSTINLFLQTNAYKTTDIFPGVLQAECETVLKEFFKEKRKIN